MKLIASVVVLVVFVGPAVSGPTYRTKRWDVHPVISEPSPALAGRDLLDALASAPDVRYSDWTKKLTAIKNSKFKACFVTDLDPELWLQEDEMDNVVKENEAEVLDSPSAYFRFLHRVGPFIGAMCREVKVYWLNTVAPPKPVPGANDNGARLPEPIKVRVNDSPPLPVINVNQPPQPTHDVIAPTHDVNVAHRDANAATTNDVKAPPPLSVFHGPEHEGPAAGQDSGHRAPPPASLYRQQAERVVPTPPPVSLYRQQAERVVPTPPPVSLYRQGVEPRQQANQKVQQTERVIPTPPPLAQWNRHNAN